MKTTFRHLAVALLASFCGSAIPSAHAALGGDSGIVIPYAGKLELNGALVTGSIDFRFEVQVSSTATTACQTVPLSVPVTNGEFAVTIPGVREECVKGQDVHLQIAVKQTDDGSFVVLGKQRVTPVLGAVTSGPGDFAVTGVLSATSVVVTSADNAPGTNIGEFKAQDGLQGVGIGFNTVRATGGNGDVDLNLTPKGTGVVKVNGPLTVTGAVNVPGGSITGPMLRADPIGCVTVQKAVTGAGVQQAFVLLRDFGFGTSHTRTGGGCRCQSDTGNQVMVFNNPDPNFDDAWSCICKDTSSSAVTTAFVIGCRLR